MNGFELSDLTIDCNLAGQPDTGAGFPQIMAGGVDLRGPNMVIRRVRVINFGTNTKSWECFGIGIAYAEASDTPVASNCVIEDCVIERPALANARETTCLNLSAFENDKLQAALVEAFARLAQRSENVHLYLLMNPCDVGHNLVTLLRRHRLEGKADISSPDLNLSQALADADLNRLYNPFDVMALPTMGEGFGLPIIESLAAGVPVVATDCSACSELVQGRGALVRPIAKLTMGTNLIEQAIIDVEDLAEQLGQLQQDPEKRQRYAVAGQAFAGTLDWDELMPQWLEVIGLAAGPQI